MNHNLHESDSGIKFSLENRIPRIHSWEYVNGLSIYLWYLGDDCIDPETQIVKAEMQVQYLVEEVFAGKKYITVKLPVSKDSEKLLKEENYEAFIKLDKENKVIYKKVDKKIKIWRFLENEFFYGWIAYSFAFYGLYRRTFCLE